MNPDKRLSVRLYGEPVGVLEQTETGKMRFVYLPQATQALSIGMPLREAPFDEVRTEAYFGGLLPESESAKRAIGKRYGVNPHNSFALLRAIGYDCAGAVSLHHLEDPVHPQVNFALSGQQLTEAALYQHIQDLPNKPLFLGMAGLRLSLAGAQEKAAVCVIDNQIAMPLDGCPTTHILKPLIPRFEGIVQNEYLCLRIASRIGLNVPTVEIRWAQEAPYYLIERYDRVVQDGQVRRIHQEDFCQALGVVSAQKYQNEGGPDFQACFDLLRQTTQPVKDRNALSALMVFNYLMGNLDAHGKNFSLLHPNAGRVEIAPAYDILCTRIYTGLTQKMAMKIGGYYEPDKILPRHWERHCKALGYAYPVLRETLFKQAGAILEAAQLERTHMIETGLFHPAVDDVLLFLEKHIAKTLTAFEVSHDG